MKEIPLNFWRAAGYVTALGFCPVIGLGTGHWIAGGVVAIVATILMSVVNRQ